MRLRYAMVCSSNQNRSMEAHLLLKRQNMAVSSYGTGTHVKLPGPSIREPNVYEFGTPYKHMFEELRRKDTELYKRNGILPMLKRNMSVKTAPQRWQDNASDGYFDVVLTFEEKVFDMVVEGMMDEYTKRENNENEEQFKEPNHGIQFLDSFLELKIDKILTVYAFDDVADLNTRDQILMKPVLVMNLEVKDNHEEAAIGGQLALELCQEIDATEFWENSIDEIVSGFEHRHRRKLFYSISFY